MCRACKNYTLTKLVTLVRFYGLLSSEIGILHLLFTEFWVRKGDIPNNAKLRQHISFDTVTHAIFGHGKVFFNRHSNSVARLSDIMNIVCS